MGPGVAHVHCTLFIHNSGAAESQAAEWLVWALGPLRRDSNMRCQQQQPLNNHSHYSRIKLSIASSNRRQRWCPQSKQSSLVTLRYHLTSHNLSTISSTLYSKTNRPCGENLLLAHVVSSWVGWRVDRRAGRVMGSLCNWCTKWIWHLKFGTTRVTQVPRPDNRMRGRWGGAEGGGEEAISYQPRAMYMYMYICTPCSACLSLSGQVMVRGRSGGQVNVTWTPGERQVKFTGISCEI